MVETKDDLIPILSALSIDDDMKDSSITKIGETSSSSANYVIFYDMNEFAVLVFNRGNKKVDIKLLPEDICKQLAAKFGDLSGSSFEYWAEQMYLEASNHMNEDLWMSIFNGLKSKLINASHWQ